MDARRGPRHSRMLYLRMSKTRLRISSRWTTFEKNGRRFRRKANSTKLTPLAPRPANEDDAILFRTKSVVSFRLRPRFGQFDLLASKAHIACMSSFLS